MKTGDVVIRTADEFKGMKKGDLATVVSYDPRPSGLVEITLEEFDGLHSGSSLRLATPEEIQAKGFVLKIAEPLMFN